MALTNLSLKFDQIKRSVENVRFADVALSDEFKAEYENFLTSHSANGYLKIEWSKFSAKIITSSGKNIFLTNFWFYIAFELTAYLDGLTAHREIFKEIYKGENLQEVARSLRVEISDSDREKVSQYFVTHGYSKDELDYFLKFITNYQSWGGGKTIDRNDYYVSPLLQAGNLLAETQSAIAEIAKQLAESDSLRSSFSSTFVYPAKARKYSDRTYPAIPLPKPFLLLAGISGTGKTRFVREQAKATGALNENYCLISVRPDWHEPNDLLGYISRLNGPAEYITTHVLQFIAKAWRAILDAGLSFQLETIDGQGERLVLAGGRDALNGILPYWLCLDEMNLAPVEQYFADYLSVLETREWIWQNNDFSYLCDPLLKAATIAQVADQEKLRQSLGFDDAKYDDAWQLFCQHGLGIPFNLIVAGTVNMDETTHGFSRKVIDRALSFDFGAFFPNNYKQFFTPTTNNKALSYPIWSQARPEDLAATCDPDGAKTIAFLDQVNSILNNTPFQLAYRALNELLLAVISQNPQDDLTLKAIWDDFLMCKVLPRIEGDSDKLRHAPSLLDSLLALFETECADLFNGVRPDLFRENLDGSVVDVACRTKAKLNWMQQRLTASGFTSFWP